MKKLINLPDILYEDKHILIVNKPTGLVVQGARREEESLLKILKNFIKERDNKPGNVFLGVVHKLDKMVSGVLMFAKRSKAAKKIFESFQKKEVIKVYLAKVEGKFKGESIWEDYLVWDHKKRKSVVSKKFSEGAKKAITVYSVLCHSQKETYVLLLPITGRKHQLRAVLSERGHPIIGDIKYGSQKKILNGKIILLHSLYLKFPHPMSKEELEFWAEVPDYFFIEDIKYKDRVFQLLKRVQKYLDSGKI
ncbi:MAG: RluA family pseudouridine synthase [Thermodesulfobacterium sp.]|nr:RluA family pseudouridine synthase [Thermodesulfobacterium sp.]